MPRAISLRKVNKVLKDKKGKGRPGNRADARLNRATLREEKLKRAALETKKGRAKDMVRAGFFKVTTKDATEPLSIENVRELIEKWIHRDDHDLARMQSERRTGRPPSAKETQHKMRNEAEQEEYRSGLRIPDLMDAKNLESLREWNGTLGSLSQVRFVRVPKDDPPIPVDPDVEME